MIKNFTIFIQNILSQVTANDTVMQGFNDGFLFFAFGNCLNLNAGNFVISDTQLLNGTVSQNSVDNVFGHSFAGMCQHFACTVNNICCHFFAVEVMHHCFLQHIMSKGIADVDADIFDILTVHIFVGIEIDFFNTCIIELSKKLFGDVGICFSNQVAFFIKYAGSQGTTHNLFADFVLACAKNSLAQTAAFLNQVHTNDIAIILTDNYVLCNVNQTTSQVTGVSGTQCGIGQAFTSTMRRNEVFQNSQAFTEVRFDRTVNDTTGRIGHQTTHTGQLTNLLFVTAGTGVSHHGYRIELVHGGFHQFIGNLIGCFVPQVNYLTITFVIAHQTTAEEAFNLINLMLCCFQNNFFFSRNLNIGGCDRNTGFTSIIVTHFLNNIQNLGSTQVAVQLVSLSNESAQFFLVNQLAEMPTFNFNGCFNNIAGSIQTLFNNLIFFFMIVTHFQRQLAIENSVTYSCNYQGHTGFTDSFTLFFIIDFAVGNINLDRYLQIYRMVEVSQLSFIYAAVAGSFTLNVRVILAGLFNSQIVGAQNHILCRNSNRLAVFRCQDVVYGHHQHTCFSLSLNGKRQMDSHLVTVKVGVISGTYQRMQLNSTAFGQDRLESLNAQSVQSRCTVQQYRMFLDYLFQNVPYSVGSTLYHALSTLNVSCFTAVYQTLHNEGFEQLQSHFLRQAALMHFQLRTYNDYGTSGIVNTFT